MFQRMLLGWVLLLLFSCSKKAELPTDRKPNVIILLADQWRAQATAYAGDPNVKTPNIDRLASQSINFRNAVSGMPVCCPFRASLMTGQRPLTHGVFMNDVQLDTNAVSLGKVFAAAGYRTGYIGKWHLDGHGRLQFIPPGERRQGFQYWKGNECTHNYNESVYYDNADSSRLIWEGYDAFAQTEDAIGYLTQNAEKEDPFLLVLSWGTPHAPYHTAPEAYRSQYDSAAMVLRPNVPDQMAGRVKKDLSGYYAHATALDDMVGKIRNSLTQNQLDENTIILLTADHGDLLGSQGAYKKQQPYEESIRVPMLYYVPSDLGGKPGPRNALMNSEDIMPSLLGLCNIPVPETVEGMDFSKDILGLEAIQDTLALITCVQPFGQWNKPRHGAREYRGLRTLRYTYTRDLNGPWLLFDNETDPYQLNNLIGKPEFASLSGHLDELLSRQLQETNDAFLPGLEYIAQWGYPLDETGTVPYFH
ncbi:sulfatase family protein [Flavilitoribacter nigricans]|nr:sulfatase [Flavilitoribacter nigricans]